MPVSAKAFREYATSLPHPEGLEPAERHLLANRWRDRACNEQATSAVFREVHRALAQVSAPRLLTSAALTAVNDERRHAQIAHDCAEYYAGKTLARPLERAVRTADFAGCSARESAVLYIVLTCAINESIAAGYLHRCLEECRCRLARMANRAFLRDEVKHARLGFAFLGWCGASERSLVGEALPSLFAVALRQWLHTRDYPRSLPAGYGCLSAAALESSVLSAIEELVLPGFEHLGIDVEPVRRMLHERD